MLSVLCNYLFIVEKKMKKMLDLKRISKEDEKLFMLCNVKKYDYFCV